MNAAAAAAAATDQHADGGHVCERG